MNEVIWRPQTAAARPPRRNLSATSGWKSAVVVLAALLSNGFAVTGAADLPAPVGSSNTLAAVSTLPPVATTNLTGDTALQRLMDGNRRFVEDQATHPDQTIERRATLTKGQSPFAIVLTCSDSRVAPELFFDQGLGDLFVIRNAGNVLDDHVIGSMEYAVDHLHVPLIIVVGHEKCGAVSAAVAGGDIPGHLQSVAEALGPAVEQTKGLPGDAVDNAVRANAVRAAAILTHAEPVLKQAVVDGKLLVVAARYDLETGKIEILQQMRQPVSTP